VEIRLNRRSKKFSQIQTYMIVALIKLWNSYWYWYIGIDKTFWYDSAAGDRNDCRKLISD